MRKTIEALSAYRMKNLGFDVVNTGNQNWSFGVTIPPTVNGAYADSVAKIIVEHQIALMGLAGVDIKEIGMSLGIYAEAEERVVETETESEEDETFFAVPNPNFLRVEEKFDILIKANKLNVGEPLYLNHALVNKSVNLRSSSQVEYRDAQYKPRDALKAIAHEVFTAGVTTKQADGWKGYNPLACYSVERENQLVKLDTLWNQVKHRVAGYEKTEEEIVDEDWFNLVMSSSLQGSILICNGKEATVGSKAEILFEDKTFLSMTEFGEHVGGLNEQGWGDYKVRHQGEIYNIKSD